MGGLGGWVWNWPGFLSRFGVWLAGVFWAWPFGLAMEFGCCWFVEG